MLHATTTSPLLSSSTTASTTNTPVNNRRIEVVVKQQVRMRSLAIKTTSSFASTPLVNNNTNTTTNNNNKTVNIQEENDWLKQARYTGCRNDRAKPPYSYASLIAQAILAAPEHKLTLGEIYQWIMQRYPYYQSQNSGWQNSIRHNLSLNRCFIKLDKASSGGSPPAVVVETPGKGSYWTIDESLMGELNDSGLFKRRKHRTEKRKLRKPLGDVSNKQGGYTSPMSNNKSRAMMVAAPESDGILRLFTAPSAQEMELPPMEIIESHNSLAMTLVCPELTEDNFVIPGQVVITSEYY